MEAPRHRRIVVCSRLRLLGSAHSLLLAVSAAQNDTQSFYARLPVLDRFCYASLAEPLRVDGGASKEKKQP
ncbi:MAG: hypothetical protein IJV73_06975, partial [Clostridia bacterium]|nr:hypothetical protein [Clostridia bacterium]